MRKATSIAENLLNSDVDGGMPKPSSAVLRAMGRPVVEDEDKEKDEDDENEKEPEGESDKEKEDKEDEKPKAPSAGAKPFSADTDDEKPEDDDESSEEAEGDAKESPTVDALESDWKAAFDDTGRREVAARVLDGLDKYSDFVGLVFRLGKSDAENLGRMMDDLATTEVPAEGALVGKDLPVISPADTLAGLKLKTT